MAVRMIPGEGFMQVSCQTNFLVWRIIMTQHEHTKCAYQMQLLTSTVCVRPPGLLLARKWIRSRTVSLLNLRSRYRANRDTTYTDSTCAHIRWLPGCKQGGQNTINVASFARYITCTNRCVSVWTRGFQTADRGRKSLSNTTLPVYQVQAQTCVDK